MASQISKECPRWLYEVLRDLQDSHKVTSKQMAAIDRGEAPSLSGAPIAGVTDHGELTGLIPDDDHTQYALLRGRTNGQILNGSIDLTTTSTSYPWSDSGSVFISTSNTTAGTTWNALSTANAPVNNVIVLSLATHSPGGGYGAGSTNYHTTITDTKGNTWQKLGEFTTSFFAGVEEQTVSLWICMVTVAMTTAGSDTITATFANSFAMKAIESRQFTMTAGLTFTVAGTSTGGISDSDPPSLSLSGLTSREYLFIRACAIHGTDDAHTTEYTVSSGYTTFTNDHTNSTTLASVGGNRGIAARGEFKVLTATGSTSDPTVNPLIFSDDSSLMVAVYLTTPAVGDLTLESISHTSASKINLHNSSITMNADLINFQNAGAAVTNSFIRGTDGAWVGPLQAAWILAGDSLVGVTHITGRVLDIRQTASNGVTQANLQYSATGFSGTGSGTWRGLQVVLSGTAGWTGGTVASMQGFFFSMTATLPAGVTVTEALGGLFQATPQETNSGTQGFNKVTGFRLAALGPSTPNTGHTGTQLTAVNLDFSNRAKNYTTAIVLDITMNSSSAAATITTCSLIGSSSASWTGLAGTDFYFVRFNPNSLAGFTGKKYGVWINDKMEMSVFGHLVRVGNLTDPAHWLDIAAGTTAIAPIRFTAGTNLTAATIGCIEYDGSNLFFTHGDAVRTKIVSQRGQVNSTAQAAAIGVTTLYTPPAAGYYVVHYTLEDTAGDVTAGTIQLQVNYTDDIGATNQTGAALALTAVGRDRGSFQIYSASGVISYQTNLVGIIGTAQYALRLRLEYLG